MLKHYVEFSYPESFVSEDVIREVAERNPALITLPKYAYAYRFFDRTEIIVDGEKLVGEPKNFSPLTYLGKVYTLEQVKAEFPKAKVLISNIECNGWERVIKTRWGIWIPLWEDGTVIDCE